MTIIVEKTESGGWTIRVGDRFNDALTADEALYVVAHTMITGKADHSWLQTEEDYARERVAMEKVCPNCQKDRIVARMGRPGDLCEKCRAAALLEQERRDFTITDRAKAQSPTAE
jgi:hypothetical protein